MDLNQNIAAIVTGGASGLGEAVARALAAAGARVALFDLDADRGARVAAELGGIFCKVDVADDDSAAAGFATARAAHGQERVLVNCAGIGPSARTIRRDRDTGTVTHHDLNVFRKVLEVNLLGSFRCLAMAAAGMAAADPLNADGERGVIINTASIAGQDGQIGQAAYAASKGGILGLTLPVARDLMADGIRVNTIMPGIMDTPMLATVTQEVRAALAASVPFPKRLGHTAEFADLALCMIRNSYFNAAQVRLDAGIRMAPR